MAARLYHRFGVLVTRRMELQRFFYSGYPIFTSVDQFSSNPNRASFDPRGRRYCQSTSRFQKTDMVILDVSMAIFWRVSLRLYSQSAFP